MNRSLRRIAWSVAILAMAASVSAQGTEVFVVRHADRAPLPQPDGLTLEGMRRANELGRVLHGARLSAVYSTLTIRTMQTATQAALDAGVEITTYTDSSSLSVLRPWAQALKAEHTGESILIVGHGHTVPVIIQAFGGEPPILGGFGDLFALTFENGATQVDARRYEVIHDRGLVSFGGGFSAPGDISGIASTRNHSLVLVASDERDDEDRNVVDVFEPDGEGYKRRQTLVLAGDDEIDIEGLTRHGDDNVFFVLGSHSYRRRNIYSRPRSYARNLERFEDESPDPEPSRDRLIRLELMADGTLAREPVEVGGLRQVLEANKVLTHFDEVPSKENGVDIEGIASDGVELYLGFRGPVFRFGLTPVLVLPPDDPSAARLRYVTLDGRGIRDLARVRDGFLVLAGPVGDSALSSALYFWDGKTCLPGRRESGDPELCTTAFLGVIPTLEDAQAEALLPVQETVDSYEFLVLYDGADEGRPTRFDAAKP